MKKLITTMLIVLGLNLADAQVKSTGTVTIPGTYKPMTIKLDMYKGQGVLLMTITGPADRLFCIGFGTTTMDGTDSATFTKANAYLQQGGEPYRAPGASVLLDTQGFAGHSAITTDAGDNDWTVISDLSSNATRTVVAVRPLDTGNTTEDYKFDFDNLTDLDLIWAMWRDAAVPGTDDGMWALSGKTSTNASSRHSGSTTNTRGTVHVTFSPTGGKSTGIVNLTPAGAAKPMTLKLDMDQSNSRIYMTASGPTDRMFQIGFGGMDMASVSDAVAITKLGACDQLGTGTTTSPVPYIAPGANAVLDTNGFNGTPGSHRATVKDVTNDWTVVSDDGGDPTKTIRTVIAYRPLNTNSTEGDYVFDYNNLTTLNVIWAQGRDVPSNPTAPDNGYWALSGKNTVGTTTRHGSGDTTQRGTAVMTFATLGIADNAYSDKITVYPNPAKNTVNILASTTISTIKIFDINAKLLKVINPDATNDLTIDISYLRSGIYFMEISNDKDKTVKKILKE